MDDVFFSLLSLRLLSSTSIFLCSIYYLLFVPSLYHSLALLRLYL